MPISMFLKANVQRLRSYQKLNRLNSLSVLDEVISLSMSHGHSTTHCGDARALLLSFERRGYVRAYVARSSGVVEEGCTSSV